MRAVTLKALLLGSAEKHPHRCVCLERANCYYYFGIDSNLKKMPEQSRSEIGSSILEALEQSLIEDQKDDERLCMKLLGLLSLIEILVGAFQHATLRV